MMPMKVPTAFPSTVSFGMGHAQQVNGNLWSFLFQVKQPTYNLEISSMKIMVDSITYFVRLCVAAVLPADLAAGCLAGACFRAGTTKVRTNWTILVRLAGHNRLSNTF